MSCEGTHTRNTIPEGIRGILGKKMFIIVRTLLIRMYSSQIEQVNRAPMWPPTREPPTLSSLYSLNNLVESLVAEGLPKSEMVLLVCDISLSASRVWMPTGGVLWKVPDLGPPASYCLSGVIGGSAVSLNLISAHNSLQDNMDFFFLLEGGTVLKNKDC